MLALFRTFGSDPSIALSVLRSWRWWTRRARILRRLVWEVSTAITSLSSSSRSGWDLGGCARGRTLHTRFRFLDGRYG